MLTTDPPDAEAGPLHLSVDALQTMVEMDVAQLTTAPGQTGEV